VNMIADWWFKPELLPEGQQFHIIPIWGKLTAIVVLLGISIAVSIVVKKRSRGQGTGISDK
jgi:hypothetical protein